MIPIDTRKFNLPRTVAIQPCKDESVRFILYTNPEPPEEYATFQRRPSYYGESTEYTVTVHLPKLRELVSCVTVAHTSPNCWKVTVSTLYSSDIIVCKTLNEVQDILKRVFV